MSREILWDCRAGAVVLEVSPHSQHRDLGMAGNLSRKLAGMTYTSGPA